jgi:catechol 2,3-dioxygenase-like lactoylglutathione lyase family enzyme
MMQSFSVGVGAHMSKTVMLEHSSVATRLPVQDLGRARLFYAEKLGLEPVEERPGGLLYRCGSGSFALFISSGASSGDFTQMAFEVTDLKATLEALRTRGVMFEEYDLPGLKTVDGIAEVAGTTRARAVSVNSPLGFGTARGTFSPSRP